MSNNSKGKSDKIDRLEANKKVSKSKKQAKMVQRILDTRKSNLRYDTRTHSVTLTRKADD